MEVFTMGKKKKKKNKHKYEYSGCDIFEMASGSSRKRLSREFDDALEEIEAYRIQLYEADKKRKKKERRKINKREGEFYTDMESLRCREKMAKTWQKNGFLDRIILLLQKVSPIVKTLAKLVMAFIITFLSLDVIKERIKPETLNKLAKVFNIAMSV